jgi:divalent metal cation (Fe/Co/Zn/Cd) transporter
LLFRRLSADMKADERDHLLERANLLALLTIGFNLVEGMVSISIMWLLIRHKTKVGAALDSPAILADAACSSACVYLSIVLLLASLGFHLTGMESLDAIGALLIAWLAGKEGRESFAKAKGLSCSCEGKCSSSSG